MTGGGWQGAPIGPVGRAPAQPPSSIDLEEMLAVARRATRGRWHADEGGCSGYQVAEVHVGDVRVDVCAPEPLGEVFEADARADAEHIVVWCPVNAEQVAQHVLDQETAVSALEEALARVVALADATGLHDELVALADPLVAALIPEPRLDVLR